MTSSTTTTPPSSPPMSPRDIVAPLTPTRSSSPTTTSSSVVLPRIPSDLHDAKSDLDPTEWKPVIHSHQSVGSSRRNPSSTSLSSSSEAWTFLSQFHHHHYHHHQQNREETTSAGSGFGYGLGLRRSTTHRSSAVSLLSSTLAPSLINTPSTMASSLSSSASSPPDYVSHHDGASAKATRPLPPRHNPSYTGASATKGVELVVPHIAAPVLDTTTTATATTTAGTTGAGESLASSPTDSHDGGVWLKAHRRQSAAASGTTTGPTASSFATAVLVDQAH